MSEANTVAVVALIVSLIALFVALVQLLQQVFGTADGYRKCQFSVIGPWQDYTRLSRRWREFRLETMYKTPEITFVDIPEESPSSKKDLDEGTGLLSQLTSRFKFEKRTPDMVTWIQFLDQIHDQEQKAASVYTGFSLSSPFTPSSTHQTVVKIEAIERSWDLISPEIVKPLASTTFGHLIVLAHRLGMRWRDLRVSEGFMLAEGKGHSLTSTLVKGVGPVFQYSLHQKQLPSRLGRRATAAGRFYEREALIPYRDVDMMACGFIPYCQDIGLQRANLTGATAQETRSLISSALLDLGVKQHMVLRMTARDRLTKVRDDPLDTGTSLAFGDWFGITVDFLPRVNSVVTQIIGPYYTRKTASSFSLGRCRKTYMNLLRQYIDASCNQCAVLRKTLNYLECFENDYNADFHCRWESSLIRISREATTENLIKKNQFTEKLREAHNFTTDELRQIRTSRDEPEKSTIKVEYRRLVAAHISVVFKAYEKALKEDQSVFLKSIGDTQAFRFHVRQRTVQLCVESLPDIVANVKPADRELESGEREAIQRAWWLLVLRGISWYMSVWVTESDYFVPYHFYDSQSTVWIT